MKESSKHKSINGVSPLNTYLSLLIGFIFISCQGSFLPTGEKDSLSPLINLEATPNQFGESIDGGGGGEPWDPTKLSENVYLTTIEKDELTVQTYGQATNQVLFNYFFKLFNIVQNENDLNAVKVQANAASSDSYEKLGDKAFLDINALEVFNLELQMLDSNFYFLTVINSKKDKNNKNAHIGIGTILTATDTHEIVMGFKKSFETLLYCQDQVTPSNNLIAIRYENNEKLHFGSLGNQEFYQLFESSLVINPNGTLTFNGETYQLKIIAGALNLGRAIIGLENFICSLDLKPNVISDSHANVNLNKLK
jgi:hypothetical protein